MENHDTEKEEKQDPRPTRRGIYLLPNLLTTAGLFAGFYAIVAAMNHYYEAAAIAIFVAMITDGLDGRVARMTHTQSKFGAEYDSLVDMVAFGLAPALVVYEWALRDLNKLGWLAAFVYAAATALRLARFNTQISTSNKRFFQGLASPAAAALMAGMVWMGHRFDLPREFIPYLALFISVSSGALMVSIIRYRSFKDLDLKGRVPFVVVLLVVLVFVFITINPPLVLFSLFFGYALSGPIYSLVKIRQTRLLRNKRKSLLSKDIQEKDKFSKS